MSKNTLRNDIPNIIPESNDIVNKLWDHKYIGSFPLGTLVLLVPLDHALREINSDFKVNLSASVFRRILKEEDIQVFTTVDDWDKYKNPDKFKKKRYY